MKNDYNVYNEKDLYLRTRIQVYINKDKYTEDDALTLAVEMEGKSIEDKRKIREYIRMQRKERQEIATAIKK